jgi:hypothetical protein
MKSAMYEARYSLLSSPTSIIPNDSKMSIIMEYLVYYFVYTHRITIKLSFLLSKKLTHIMDINHIIHCITSNDLSPIHTITFLMVPHQRLSLMIDEYDNHYTFQPKHRSSHGHSSLSRRHSVGPTCDVSSSLSHTSTCRIIKQLITSNLFLKNPNVIDYSVHFEMDKDEEKKHNKIDTYSEGDEDGDYVDDDGSVEL